MTQESVVSKNVHGRTHKRDIRIAMLLPGLPGRETGPRELHLPFLPLPTDVRQPCDPRRPRHAQQTSPTTRSGRHAAFIMFPRSSFDGSTPAEPRVE